LGRKFLASDDDLYDFLIVTEGICPEHDLKLAYSKIDVLFSRVKVPARFLKSETGIYILSIIIFESKKVPLPFYYLSLRKSLEWSL
jgi:hypothetical protein